MCGLVNTISFSNYKWRRVQAEAFSFSGETTAPEADSQGDPLGYFAVLSGKEFCKWTKYFAC